MHSEPANPRHGFTHAVQTDATKRYTCRKYGKLHIIRLHYNLRIMDVSHTADSLLIQSQLGMRHCKPALCGSRPQSPHTRGLAVC